MGLTDWLRSFRALHEKAKRGALPPRELVTYREGRDELARALLAAQRVLIKPGNPPRRQLRVSRALPVDVELGREKARSLTLDLSVGGFGTLLASAPIPGEQAKVSIKLPEQEAVVAVAQVVDVQVQMGNSRAALAFRALPEADAERLETFIFDAVLEQLAG